MALGLGVAQIREQPALRLALVHDGALAHSIPDVPKSHLWGAMDGGEGIVQVFELGPHDNWYQKCNRPATPAKMDSKRRLCNCCALNVTPSHTISVLLLLTYQYLLGHTV